MGPERRLKKKGGSMTCLTKINLDQILTIGKKAKIKP